VTRRALALCMVVRDDEEIVERSLRSVARLIDYWVVCDAGSKDRTAMIIADVLSGVPGELHHTEWVDFGHNRTELMALAHDKADYLLLLDPDMTLVSRGPLPDLVEDAYVVPELGERPAPGVPRVVRGSRRWWFEGSSHEILATNGHYREVVLDGFGIDRHTDPVLRERMLLRQLDILERDVVTEATPRTVFELAQTLQALGRDAAAIEWYHRRVELGDRDQETFYANLQEGRLRARKNFWAAVPILLQAWQRRPTRAEPLYELARGYRQRGDAGLAYHFADVGLQIPVPTDTFSVEPWVYAWGLRMERGWAAGRLERIEDAEADLRAVFATDGVPEDFVRVVGEWLENLAQNPLGLEGAKPVRASDLQLNSLVDGVRLGRIELAIESDWPPLNPSIAPDGDGFSMIVRTTNYLGGKGNLVSEESARLNVNYRVELDADLSVLQVDRIDEQVEGLPRYPARKVGFMDYRLIKVGGRWYASATSQELNPEELWEMVLLELDGAKVASALRLSGPQPDRDEKNWMPFIHEGALHFVYTCGPLVVLRCDHRNGHLSPVAHNESPKVASNFRGSSQGVPIDDGYLFVVHETYLSGQKRSYLHRFIRIGSDLRLNAVSPPFTFTEAVREFCVGAALRGSELVLSFGQKNVAAYLAGLPLASAVELLETVDRYPR
jgi:hypothetical protein